MKKIFKNVIKKKVLNLIKFHKQELNEILIDIDVSFGLINSIELDEEENILLHIFDENDFDIVCDFSDLDENDQFVVLKVLNTI